MVVVTHEMGFAREVSNQLIFPYKGLVEENGCPKEVLGNPRSGRFAAISCRELEVTSGQPFRVALKPACRRIVGSWLGQRPCMRGMTYTLAVPQFCIVGSWIHYRQTHAGLPSQTSGTTSPGLRLI